jgi:hypothetical protein
VFPVGLVGAPSIVAPFRPVVWDFPIWFGFFIPFRSGLVFLFCFLAFVACCCLDFGGGDVKVE